VKKRHPCGFSVHGGAIAEAGGLRQAIELAIFTSVTIAACGSSL